MIQIIEGWLRRLDDIGEAERQLMEAGVPCAKVYSPEDAFQDPHFNTCGWITKIPAPAGVTSIDGRFFPSNPFTFSAVAPQYRPAPTLGQDNHSILERLGYSFEEVENMQKEWSEKAKK